MNMFNALIKRTIIPMVILLFASCQKEANQIIENSSDEVTASRGSSSSGCRMTMYDYYNSFDDYHQIENITYKKGLVDEWTTFYGYTYKMEYDKNNQLKIARVFVENDLLFIVKLIYKNNKVVNEVWYNAITMDIDDNVFYTYNKKGNMLRNESFINKFFVDYTYYANGALKSWFYYIEGLPFQKAEYTYKDAHKNPYLAIPGMDYTIVYVNAGFGIGTGNKWYSSEKISYFDENGDPVIDYEQDPNQTTWQMGRQDYPLIVDYIDKWGEGHIFNTFEYENCNPGDDHHSANKKQNIIGNTDRQTKAFKGLMHGLSKNTIEKLKAEKLNKKSN